MGGTPTDANHLVFKLSGSTSRFENPSISISESITNPRLPHDLITEILLRLPVKSLLRFKCASKSWLSSISSPEFIKSHFSTSYEAGRYLNHRLLFTILDSTPRMKKCSLYSALHEAEPYTFVSDFEYFCQNPDHPPWIVGIVNGLVCVAITTTELCLWNPALRKFKHLPSSIVNLEPPFKSVAVNYGFGYDESNDDYKVVGVLSLCGSEGVFKDEVKVYSLRADSWRRIDELKGFLPIDDLGIYANGKIYWSANEPGDPSDWIQIRKIVSLDMVSEKYGELQQPDYEAGHFIWKLGVLGGRLFVLCDYSGTRLDLWAMDKYGVEESWCRVVSIPFDDVYRPTPYSHERVLCFLSNDEVVLVNGRGLLVYHTKHKKSRNIELDVGRSFFKVVPYVESMVSPNGSSL